MEPELSLLESFSKSKLWKWTFSYLTYRREALFNQECKDNNDLWRNKGAIDEINRLLKAPQLVLEYYKRQAASEQSGADIDGTEPTGERLRSMYEE